MADVKISALPSASTPLDGTEILPIVQGGITEQVSVENLTAGRTVAAATVNVDANSATSAVRITQTGAGNALLVEDSASTDSTPFVIDSAGKVIAGATAAVSSIGVVPGFQAIGVTGNGASATGLFAGFLNDATTAGSINLGKSRNTVATVGSIVSSGDRLGSIQFVGDDGAALIRGAAITAEVDGTPGTNDMPGRLVFSTTADGASAPTERMRIDSAGRVGIGSTSLTGFNIRSSLNPTGATSTTNLRVDGTIQSDVTSTSIVFASFPATAAASFTLSNLRHFQASQNTIGAGSAVTTQTGFLAESTLIGATNNYGFYGNIAAGTGRWNFYAAGTADNYFGGATTISTSSTDAALRVTQTGAGNALLVEDTTNPDSSPFIVDASGNVVVGYTSTVSVGGGTRPLTVNGAGQILVRATNDTSGPTLNLGKTRSTSLASNTIVQNGDQLGGIFFAGDDGANINSSGASIVAAVDGTPGAGDMPGRLVFSTTADGASASTERMRISNAGFTTLTGSFGRGAPVTKTADFTLATTENWLICNGAGTITVTLPAASSWTGREVMLKTIAAQTVVSASSNVVPLVGGAAGTAILAATAGKFATLVSDGTNWIIMQGN